MSAFVMPAPDGDQELRELEYRRCAAICDRDLELLTKMMSDTLTYVHIHGNVEDKQAYLAGLVDLRDFKSVERENLKIQICGDVALMTGIQRVLVRRLDTDNAEYRGLTVFATQVWARTDGNWQMEVYQSTKI